MSNKPSCVICQEDTSTSSNPFLSPCSCKGSVSSIHRECLEEWIFHSNKTNCSICHVKYRIQMKEELVSASKVTLLLQALLYYFATMFVLTGIFFLSHPNTYQFESTNTLDSISLCLLTTNLHLGITIWYGFIFLLSIVVILGSLLAIITVLTGESSGLEYTMRDMNGISQMFDSISAVYPFANSFRSCFSSHIYSIVLVSFTVFLTYKLLKYRNHSVNRLRIQI
jgi:hypothetical protein